MHHVFNALVHVILDVVFSELLNARLFKIKNAFFAAPNSTSLTRDELGRTLISLWLSSSSFWFWIRRCFCSSYILKFDIEFASVKTIDDTTLSRHNEVMFDLMMPLGALNIFANARIKFARKSTVAVTHVVDF